MHSENLSTHSLKTNKKEKGASRKHNQSKSAPSAKSRHLIHAVLPETIHAPAPGAREAIIPPARVDRAVGVGDAEVGGAAAGQPELHAVGEGEEAAVELARVLAVGAQEGVLAGVLAVDPGRVVLVVGVVVVVGYADLDGGEAGGEEESEEGGGGGGGGRESHFWGIGVGSMLEFDVIFGKGWILVAMVV